MTATRTHRLGFAQLDPLPEPSELAAFYQSRYYDLLRRGGRAPEIRKLLDAAERPAELAWLEATLYRDLLDATGARSPALDVGCGAGDLVAWLRAQGVDAEGLDPSEDAVAEARARGVPAHRATLEAWAADPANHGRYGAITLVNVLEHVPDPIAVLGAVRDLLRADGIVAFRVPNDFTALQAAAEAVVTRPGWWIAAPDHINYFRADSARAACAEAGLEVLSVSVDFPMELFLLMGINYVDHPERGAEAHQLRKQLELGLPVELRRALYGAFAAAGMGRNLLVAARRR